MLNEFSIKRLRNVKWNKVLNEQEIPQEYLLCGTILSILNPLQAWSFTRVVILGIRS